MLPKIFIDGQDGTTGLRLRELLARRGDISLLEIPAEQRKDAGKRAAFLNAADLVFLCLPDAAAKEAVGLIINPATRVIDASTAHRTNPDWAYGLPELSTTHREKLRRAKRVANPGCHATAFLLPMVPLVAAEIVPAKMPVTCFSLTGYSGGGKKMIAAYESPDAPEKFKAPRPYALRLTHKHQPEMQVIAGLRHPPLFVPVVCNVHSGLAVQTFLPAALLQKEISAEAVHAHLSRHYAGEAFVKVLPFDAEAKLDDGFYDITACNGTNRADISVFGNAQQIVVSTRLDNLGKGAAGAAVQAMNLMLGLAEGTGLSA